MSKKLNSLPSKLYSKPTIAVAFGGGGARGLAHIHVVAAFEELGLHPSAISGTSMGAVIGSAYASGMTSVEIKEYATRALGSKTGLIFKLWGSVTSDLPSIITRGLKKGPLDIEGIMNSFIPSGLPSNFEDLSVPLTLVATDIHSGDDVILDEGNLRKAIAASSCIPSIFQPVEINGQVLIDGGTSNPVPMEYLVGTADITVAIDVTGVHVDPSTVISANSVLYRASQILQKTIVDEKVARYRPEVFLRPYLNGYKSLDFAKAREIIEYTSPLKDRAKRLIENALLKIELLNDHLPLQCAD